MSLEIAGERDLDWTDSSHLDKGNLEHKEAPIDEMRASQHNHGGSQPTEQPSYVPTHVHTYIGVYHKVTTQDKDAQNIPFPATTHGLPEHLRAEIVNYRYNPNFKQEPIMQALQDEARGIDHNGDGPQNRLIRKIEESYALTGRPEDAPRTGPTMEQVEAAYTKAILAGHRRQAVTATIATTTSGTTVRQNYTPAGQRTRDGMWYPSDHDLDALKQDERAKAEELRRIDAANEAAHYADTAPERRLTLVGGSVQTRSRGWTDDTSGNGNPEGPPPFTPVARLNWGTFLDEDFGKAEFMAGQLMQPGQQAALVGEGKAGKSLFALEWAQAVASGRPFLDDKPRKAARVLYVDQENSWVDIQARAHSLGYTSSDLDGIHYLSFPQMPPLDTAEGGDWLMTQVDQAGAEVVILDTVSRMVEGKENDSDTWLNLYRLTLKRIKSRKIGSLRLDHFGKDVERGSRGSSAKNQDVDAVWELTAGGRAGTWGQPLRLKRTHTRSGLGPGEIHMNREGVKTSDGDGESWARGQTRHVTRDIPTGLEGIGDFKVAEELARLASVIGVPAGAGRQALKAKVMAAYPDRRHSDTVWSDAVRLRKGAGIDED